METLDLILHRTNLAGIITQMRATTNDIKNAQPHKVDLIERQEVGIKKLTGIYVAFCELEMEYRAARQRANDLEYTKFGDMEALKLLVKQNEQLVSQNKNLVDNMKDFNP